MPNKIQMINKLKKDIESNKDQKEINLGLINLIELFLQQKPDGSMNVERKSSTIIDFIKKREHTQHIDIISDFAYYCEYYKEMKSFNVEDVRNLYEEARMKPPQNINDIISKLERDKGFLIECKEKKDGKKAWRLSSSGLDYTESFTPETA